MNENNTLIEKIGAFLKPLLDGQTRIITTMKALEAGQNDIREKMATKEDVRASEERTKEAMRAEIHTTQVPKRGVEGAHGRQPSEQTAWNDPASAW